MDIVYREGGVPTLPEGIVTSEGALPSLVCRMRTRPEPQPVKEAEPGPEAEPKTS